jgi:hypothetical protein
MTNYQPSRPHPDLKSLDKLVGTWKQSGGVEGTITYEWAEGGFFLIQRVDMDHSGHKIKGMEIIGHLQLFGEEPSQDIKSRFYNFLDGMTLDYVYEMDGDMLTIWGGERGSPAYYRGTLNADGNTLTGGWVYPGGGGYEATSTRIK